MTKIKNKFFFILAFLMSLVILISNYLVQFPINYLGLKNLLTYGAFSYPVAFLITDLSNRRYGKEAAKRRKAFCARSRSWTGPRGKAARRRWKC